MLGTVYVDIIQANAPARAFSVSCSDDFSSGFKLYPTSSPLSFKCQSAN